MGENKIVETTNTIRFKLYMNNHWMVSYSFHFMCVANNPRRPPPHDSFNIVSYWKKNFKNFLINYKFPNYTRIIISLSFTKLSFYVLDQKSKMAATIDTF